MQWYAVININIIYYNFIFITFIAGSSGCTLKDVLQFCTGNRVLSLGVSPKVKFREGQLATSSTCAMEIYLPLDHSNYTSFKEAMVLAIKGNDGFGKC